jgi:TRAP-type C4-dicarboxylate transport system permease large subunit
VGQLGFDPVWWGIMNVMIIEIGMITPPVGINIFVLHGMRPDLKLAQIYRGIVPFIVVDVVRIAIFLLFPGLMLVFV